VHPNAIRTAAMKLLGFSYPIATAVPGREVLKASEGSVERLRVPAVKAISEQGWVSTSENRL